MDGAKYRILRELDASVVGAWHSANLGRAQKLPKLADYLPDRDKKPRRLMAPEEIQAALAGWAGRKKQNG